MTDADQRNWNDTAEIDRLRGENARLLSDPMNVGWQRAQDAIKDRAAAVSQWKAAMKRIAALEAERDAAIASAPTQGALGEALKIVQAERDAMRHLALWMRSQTSCENYHHDKREQHSGSECPVEARIDAELNWRKP